ncbi:hypothetical protein RclHR1_18690001 [Rhizophagus clarus]|nr:hypothetical protein RclHR1_18690001 [Rhizophagus clarus]
MSLKSAWKRDDVRALFSAVMTYCSDKFEKRFNKLMDDIARDRNKNHIISFKSFMISTSSIDVDNLDNAERHVTSRVCAEYYKKVKKSSKIPENFLRHVRKVGSYLGSLINIVKCVCKEFHKGQIANLELKVLEPIKTYQTISSWNTTIRSVVGSKEFKDFRNACLNDDDTKDDLEKIYGDPITTQLDSEINQCVCLHVEMNMLADIVSRGDKSRAFIAVSKDCCYLCELYIEFAQKQGYNIVVSGSHKKIYHAWKLPDIKDYTFWSNSVAYMITNLDLIIKNEVQEHNHLLAQSDSEGNSLDSSLTLDKEDRDDIDAVLAP